MDILLVPMLWYCIPLVERYYHWFLTIWLKSYIVSQFSNQLLVGHFGLCGCVHDSPLLLRFKSYMQSQLQIHSRGFSVYCSLSPSVTILNKECTSHQQPTKKIQFQSRSSTYNGKLKKQMTMNRTSQIVAVRHNLASHLASYTQWSSVLAKLCPQPQQMCPKYCIRT